MRPVLQIGVQPPETAKIDEEEIEGGVELEVVCDGNGGLGADAEIPRKTGRQDAQCDRYHHNCRQP